MKLHSMKATEAEKKEREKKLSSGSAPMGMSHDGPTLHLNDGHMEKMGLKDTFKPGDTYHFEGRAKVGHSSADDKGHRSVELRIHKMGAEKHEGSSLRDDIEDAADGGKQGKPEKLAREQDKGKDAGARAATGRAIPKGEA